MPLYFFYTMVQKSQKWPKTQIKGGGPALSKITPPSFVNFKFHISSKTDLYLNFIAKDTAQLGPAGVRLY